MGPTCNRGRPICLCITIKRYRPSGIDWGLWYSELYGVIQWPGIVCSTLRLSAGLCFYLCGSCGQATKLERHCSNRWCFWVTCPCGCINKYP